MGGVKDLILGQASLFGELMELWKNEHKNLCSDGDKCMQLDGPRKARISCSRS